VPSQRSATATRPTGADSSQQSRSLALLRSLRGVLRRRYRARLSHARVWERELPTEVDFWAWYVRTSGGDFPEEFRQRLDPQSLLDDPLVADRVALIARDPVRILDVGAGPMTSLGKTHPQRKLQITAVDPLAEEYSKLLEAAAVTPPVPTLACRGEELTTRFAPASFDVIYARNSLDHSEHPMKIIESMLRLLAPNGFIALRHYRNEGEHMTYEELHQWNFELREGELQLWSTREQHNVTAELAGRATLECWQHPGSYHADWIAAVIRHCAPAPA
jgi:SAM-dependent methyltransferase